MSAPNTPLGPVEVANLRHEILRRIAPWEPTNLYAIVDGARDPRAHPLVVGSGLPWRCLYDGALAPPLAAAAPYLLQVRWENRAVEELLSHWSDAWGFFIETPASLDELRKHLRRFLLVLAPDHARMLFRFYDPRVLRGYLPTCTGDELRAWWGPMRHLLVEGDQRNQLFEATLAGSSLQLLRIPVTGVAPC
jgi:hypothetical protein